MNLLRALWPIKFFGFTTCCLAYHCGATLRSRRSLRLDFQRPARKTAEDTEDAEECTAI